MPTDQNAAPTTHTEMYKKLIRTKCPETFESTGPQVFASILISLSERTERLERENVKLRKTMGMMAKVLQAITVTDGGAKPEAEAEGAATEVDDEEDPGRTDASTASAGGGGGGSAGGPVRKQDATPFPSGISDTVAGATPAGPGGTVAPASNAAPKNGPPVAAAAGPPSKTGPVDDGDVSIEDLTPNAGGGPAVNAQPIPRAPSNGRRPNA